MSIKKTYIPAKPRSKKLIGVVGAIGKSTSASAADLLGSGNFLPRSEFDSMFEWDEENNAIKAKSTLFSVGGLSPYGKGLGQPPTGVSYLHELLDVEVSTKQDKQVLQYDIATGKWVNKTITVDGGVSSWDDLNDRPLSLINIDTLLLDKVDKVIGKSLIADLEITRLSTVTNQDISGKVDKVAGKSLILDTEITRLASVTNQDLSSYITKPNADTYYKPIGYQPTWLQVTGKPETFTPSAHYHAISDIANLQAALNAKISSESPTFTGTAKAPIFEATENIKTPLLKLGSGWEFVQVGDNIEMLYYGVTKQIYTKDGDIVAIRGLSAYGAGSTTSLIVDNLLSTAPDKILSARMGNELYLTKAGFDIGDVDSSGYFEPVKGGRMVDASRLSTGLYRINLLESTVNYFVNVSLPDPHTQTYKATYYATYFTIEIKQSGSLTNVGFRVQLIY